MMGFKIKNGEMVRTGKASGTKRSVFSSCETESNHPAQPQIKIEFYGDNPPDDCDEIYIVVMGERIFRRDNAQWVPMRPGVQQLIEAPTTNTVQ
jgi:hypothetical protein